eukprot:6175157-Pleurochrysis_carterae.AAC.2
MHSCYKDHSRSAGSMQQLRAAAVGRCGGNAAGGFRLHPAEPEPRWGWLGHPYAHVMPCLAPAVDRVALILARFLQLTNHLFVVRRLALLGHYVGTMRCAHGPRHSDGGIRSLLLQHAHMHRHSA